MLTNPQGPPSPEARAPRNPLLYSSIALGITSVVVGWIMFSRWQQNRYIERRNAQEKAQKRLDDDRVTLEQLGGKELAIQSFYASPGAVHKGESVQLCYGVANAKTVTLEPQPNAVWPSYARCVSVEPVKTTVYTLTISDPSGNTRTQSVTVTVE